MVSEELVQWEYMDYPLKRSDETDEEYKKRLNDWLTETKETNNDN